MRFSPSAGALFLLFTTTPCEAPPPLARPTRVTVRLDGPVVDAALDDGAFIEWPTVETQLAALSDGPPVAARLRVRNATALQFGLWSDRLEELLGLPVTVELSAPGPELRVTRKWEQILEDDPWECVRIDGAIDGRWLTLGLHEAKPKAQPYNFRSPQDAVWEMFVQANRALVVPDAPDKLECEDPWSCNSTLDRALDRIFHIGVPCGKAFVSVHHRIEWSRLETIFLALTELGVEEVTLLLE